MPTNCTIRELSPAAIRERADQLAKILVDVVRGEASVGFMHPLDHNRARAFWLGVAANADTGDRVLLIAEDASGTAVGTVQLVFAGPENQPHRADICKMLVHRSARKQGIGGALMKAIEDIARREKKTVLVLDTASADAERLYERSGWTRLGTIPNYALLPNGDMYHTVMYYKQLETPNLNV